MSAVTRAWRASFVSCTIQRPLRSAVVAHEEVGEADELGRSRTPPGRSTSASDASAAFVGRPHRPGPRHPTIAPRGSRRRRRRTARRTSASTRRSCALPSRPGALEREVLGLFDGGDAAEPRVDRAQPRELALGRRLEVARAPDDPAFVFDVAHASPSSHDHSRGIRHVAGRGRRRGRPATCQTGTVSTALPFESAYRHGFARVAACTIPIAIADPAANAEAVLASARECDADAVAVAVFPELCLTGYAIDDLVMQDAVLDAVEAAIERLVEASARSLPGARRRRAAAPPQPPLQLRRRDPSRRAARRRAEVVPADLSRVLRAPLVRAGRRPGGRGHPGRRRSRRRSGPTCCSRRSTCPASSSTPRSARTSGCRSRRRRAPRSPARRCCSTSAAAPSRSRAPRTARTSASRSRCAASPPTRTRPRAWASRRTTCRGTARR